ncbi:MAG TPA: pyridoxamine 5'-phosphate oxidase family protein [Acidimicrobiales bacterium]
MFDTNGEPDRRDRNGLEVLTDRECLELLRSASVGRVGLTIEALPAILPANFAVLDGDVIIRTGWGAKLDAATDNQVVGFEVDDFDPATRQGWSVLIRGRAEVVRDPALLERARQLNLDSWAPAPRDHYVRIRSEVVSGRRITRLVAAETSGT